MNRRETGHTLDLNKHRFIDHEIRPKPLLDGDPSVPHRKDLLPGHTVLTQNEFVTKYRLVHRLKEPRSKGRMHVVRSIDNVVSDLNQMRGKRTRRLVIAT